MKSTFRQFGWLLLVVSCAAAQNVPASLLGVKVTQTDNAVHVDVSLSVPVQPTVLITTDPNRLVLDFPNTTSDAKQQRISVNFNGVRAVRFGLHSTNPAVTRVVVDLDNVHPYELHPNGTQISLTVRQPVATHAGARRLPPSAASAGVLDIFHRRGASSPRVSDDESLKRPVPRNVPSTPSSDASTASAPTAAHPNRGSLQEGTVFPSMGSPGAGTVPAAVGSAPVIDSSSSTTTASAPATTPSQPPPATSAGNAPTVAQTAPQAPPKNDSVPSAPVESSANQASATSNSASQVISNPVSTNQVSTNQNSATQTPPSQVVSNSLPRAASEAPATSNVSALQMQPPHSTPAATSASEPVSTNATAPTSPVTSSVPAKDQPAVTPAAEGQTAGSSVVANSPPNVPQAQTTQAAVDAPSSGEATITPGADKIDLATAPPVASDQAVMALAATDPNLKTVFKVKHVADGVAYLDGGRSSGLGEGMKLEIKDSDLPIKQGLTADPSDPRIVAELAVTAVAETSAVTDIHSSKRPVKVGDVAYLSNGDAEALVQQRTMSATRQYPVVIAFSEGDPLDEEVRKVLPRPPQPSVNRARGRIGFDYMGTVSHDNPSSTNSDIGMVMRADITRIFGTHWNLTGYWRGRFSARSTTSQPTLQDLINRTYHLGMYYDSPESRWVAGVGRMYLPWAPSLDTIDGGYFGAKLGGRATLGMFAGSTPDPTSWSYNPNRRLAGTFINFEGGSYDHIHYTSTSGVGISTLKWQIDRPFVFFENTLSYKRIFSIYDSLQADSPRGNPAVPAPGPGFARNFLTVRMQVHPRVELDFNHNYLRDVPTYDPTLIGTGLLDKYLFQGLSAGARVEVAKQIFVYTSIGSSNRSGDSKKSLNELFGLTFAHLPWWKLRADAHYSRFNSSFADGSYRSFSVGRNVTDNLRLDFLFGDQNFTSTLAKSDRTRFVNSTFETSLGPHYFLQGGFTVNRGQTQNYDQWLFTFGYRFDTKAKRQR